MYKRALQGTEEALGPMHPSTLDTANNLGKLYVSQGKLAEAEEMYTRALRGYEEVLSAQTIVRYRPALNNMWNLGSLFKTQEKWTEAKEMFSKAHAGFQILLGPSSGKCRALERILASLDSQKAYSGRTSYQVGASYINDD